MATHVVIALLTITISGAVLAASADAQSHAYAVLPGQQFEGDSANLRSNNLSVPDPLTQHVSNEIWITNAAMTYWVETGLAEGAGQDFVATSPVFFWADSRPKYGYYDHDWNGARASLNTYYSSEITSAVGGVWIVLDGSETGFSTANSFPAQLLLAGTEVANTTDASACASQGSLEFEDEHGNWSSDWSDAEGPATLYEDSPPYGYWVTTSAWLRDGEHTSC